MSEVPMSWLQQIENALQIVQEVPLWGSPPSFPWKECSKQISSLLECPGLKIDHQTTQFLPLDKLTSGLGTSPVKIPVDLSPLQGSALWLMPAEDVAKLTQLILSSQETAKGFTSSEFQEGFYRYLLLNIIDEINELKSFGDLSAKLGAAQSLPQEGALCIDVSISHPKAALWGRLICPPPFHLAFKQHFSQKPSSLLDAPETQQIDLSLRVEIGHTILSHAQWKTVEIGDLIVLDRCTYDPESHKGTVSLVLEGSPLFRARLKENSLKIVEYAHYHEEVKFMDNEIPEDENDIPQDEDETAEIPENAETPEEEENDDDLSSFDSEEEADEENQDYLEEPTEESSGDIHKMIHANEVPLTIHVEVTRLQIKLDKLLQLKPGNLIELPVKPEQGVDLVLNGKKIAKGELVKLGDVLGVKILQVGN